MACGSYINKCLRPSDSFVVVASCIVQRSVQTRSRNRRRTWETWFGGPRPFGASATAGAASTVRVGVDGANGARVITTVPRPPRQRSPGRFPTRCAAEAVASIFRINHRCRILIREIRRERRQLFARLSFPTRCRLQRRRQMQRNHRSTARLPSFRSSRLCTYRARWLI